MNLTFDQCYLNDEQYSLDYADTTIILYTIFLVGTALYTWVHYSNAVTYLYYHILILHQPIQQLEDLLNDLKRLMCLEVDI